MSNTPFHLAIPVRDIAEARRFYGKGLGFPEGRSSEHWIDFNMFGHQLVVHLDETLKEQVKATSDVDGHRVPVPHFGLVLTIPEWQEFADVVAEVVDEFIMTPTIRFAGEPGEQGTMFFKDPSGNAIEFKCFRNREEQLFAK